MPKTDREGFVPLKHHELNLESRVMPESVGVWLASGWVPVDDDNEVMAPVEDEIVEVESSDEVVAEPEENE